jgi:hypothetical protein
MAEFTYCFAGFGPLTLKVANARFDLGAWGSLEKNQQE